MLLGAHYSISGGVYNAVVQADELNCTAVQLFTKNSNRWESKPISDKDARLFKEKMGQSTVEIAVAHSIYLINLASPEGELWQKSIDGMVDELERAEALGLKCVIFHPGSYKEGSKTDGIKRVSKALNAIISKTSGYKTMIAIENTGGQGTSVGGDFESLAQIADGVKEQDRIGFCFDTCHAFVAGYDLRTKEQCEDAFNEFDEKFGIENLLTIHMNDTDSELGSHLDRHQHIGEGKIGLECFRFIMNDKRFANVPKILETPKGEDLIKADGRNLDVLRKLVFST
ncbi:deoxyribonuclease IV [bacterium]|nr:deoxyribonuclease IV [bacterium]